MSLQADIGLGDYTLTSITAYRTWDSTEIREGDWLDAGPAYVGINQLHDYGPQEQDTFSQELRIASPGGQFIDYVAGLYYATTSADRYFQRDTEVCRSSTLAPSTPRACGPARRRPPSSSFRRRTLTSAPTSTTSRCSETVRSTSPTGCA